MKIADAGLQPSENSYGKLFRIAALILAAVCVVYLFADAILKTVGSLIVRDDKPVRSDAVVVLNSGIEYYPRLIEAASLYNNGFAETVVINGNRKTDVLREMEKNGFEPCCPWYEHSLRILSLYGVPRDKVIWIRKHDPIDPYHRKGSQFSAGQFKKYFIRSRVKLSPAWVD